MKNVKERLSPITKLAYGVGDIGFSLTDTTLGVLFFYLPAGCGRTGSVQSVFGDLDR